MKKTINLPQNYLDAMKELLKEDYEDYLASFVLKGFLKSEKSLRTPY